MEVPSSKTKWRDSMRVLGSFGLLFSIFFLFSLLVAIGSGGGISAEEYAPVAYFFGIFAIVLALTDLNGQKSSTKVRGAVCGLAILYLLAYSFTLASKGDRYEPRASDRYDYYVALPLSMAALRLSFALLRKPKRLASATAE
jgi:hypothetical protein